MKIAVIATMSDALEDRDYLPTDFAIGDAIEVWRSDEGEPWVQLTYNTLRLPNSNIAAWWHPPIGRWVLSSELGHHLHGRTVSDLVITVLP